jgi:hypothetical protein
LVHALTFTSAVATVPPPAVLVVGGCCGGKHTTRKHGFNMWRLASVAVNQLSQCKFEWIASDSCFDPARKWRKTERQSGPRRLHKRTKRASACPHIRRALDRWHQAGSGIGEIFCLIIQKLTHPGWEGRRRRRRLRRRLHRVVPEGHESGK